MGSLAYFDYVSAIAEASPTAQVASLTRESIIVAIAGVDGKLFEKLTFPVIFSIERSLDIPLSQTPIFS